MAALACGHASAPNEAEPLRLTAIVVVDSEVFRSRGEFYLDLVPSDASGTSFVEEEWSITAALTSPTSVGLTPVTQSLEPADTQPVATAILIDDSGSMRSSDPNRDRASAAQLFWNDILAARPGNLVALLDFGRGSVPPSPGFERTNLLVGFTSDRSALEAGLSEIQAQPGGGTPLYRAAGEVVNWIDSTTPSSYQRRLIVISDGAPSDSIFADPLFADATAKQIRLYPVGVGSAAEHDPPTEAALLLQEIAEKTGGIYAAADPSSELRPILQTLATSVVAARLLLLVRLEPTPPNGSPVMGTVTVSGARGTASTTWTFVAP
ncbi:MAG: vWA domain-containing protein [Gemmatimonadales bacterium]